MKEEARLPDGSQCAVGSDGFRVADRRDHRCRRARGRRWRCRSARVARADAVAGAVGSVGRIGPGNVRGFRVGGDTRSGGVVVWTRPCSQRLPPHGEREEDGQGGRHSPDRDARCVEGPNWPHDRPPEQRRDSYSQAFLLKTDTSHGGSDTPVSSRRSPIPLRGDGRPPPRSREAEPFAPLRSRRRRRAPRLRRPRPPDPPRPRDTPS